MIRLLFACHFACHFGDPGRPLLCGRSVASHKSGADCIQCTYQDGQSRRARHFVKDRGLSPTKSTEHLANIVSTDVTSPPPPRFHSCCSADTAVHGDRVLADPVTSTMCISVVTPAWAQFTTEILQEALRMKKQRGCTCRRLQRRKPLWPRGLVRAYPEQGRMLPACSACWRSCFARDTLSLRLGGEEGPKKDRPSNI